MAKRRGFGKIKALPSGRFQASYIGPDTARHTAPVTFETTEDAEGWLTDRRREIQGDEWRPPTKRKPITFAEFAERWLEQHTGLKPSTRARYRQLLDHDLLPAFRNQSLRHITRESVDEWHFKMGDGAPTARANAYALLRTILNDAVDRGLISVNPAQIKGAATVKRKRKIEPATLDELETIVTAMPPRLQPMVLLAAWCAMRYGELIELRRKDIDLTNGVVKVRRAAVRVNGRFEIGDPKSDAGKRDIAIPPHLLPVVKYLRSNITGGRDGLLFGAKEGGHLQPSTFYGRAPTDKRAGHGYYGARAAAGRDDLNFHSLRHTGAVLAAQSGATLAELMQRLGHSTPQMAMRYQHASAERDKAIAARLSDMATEAGK